MDNHHQLPENHPNHLGIQITLTYLLIWLRPSGLENASGYQTSNVRLSNGVGFVDVCGVNRAVAGLPVDDAELGFVEINTLRVQ